MKFKAKNFIINIINCYFIIVFFTIIDAISKHLVLEKLFKNHYDSKITINSFFHLKIVKNHGISFSFFYDWSTIAVLVLSGVAVICIMIYMIFLCYKKQNINVELFGVATIASGGLGNFLERYNYGYVSDFLVVHYKNYFFPAFNIADILVSIGFILLVIISFRKNNLSLH